MEKSKAEVVSYASTGLLVVVQKDAAGRINECQLSATRGGRQQATGARRQASKGVMEKSMQKQGAASGRVNKSSVW
jgi:hypothetical protein